MAAAATKQTRPLGRGIHTPTLVFFKEGTESLDVATIKKHAVRVGKEGVAGIVTHGSNGEAVHLTDEERAVVTRATREALDGAGMDRMPITVGCSAESVRATVEMCKAAAAAGGDYALVLPPSYYVGQHKSDTVTQFFEGVADGSPIPIIVYSYPTASRGLDVGSETMVKLARHANIAGCKLTCGNTGKLNRIVAGVEKEKLDFLVFGGSADFIVQTYVGGGAGAIVGYGNIAATSAVELAKLMEAKQFDKAKKLQVAVANADEVLIRSGLAGSKYVLNAVHGYGGVPRSPISGMDPKEGAEWVAKFDIGAITAAVAEARK